MSDLYLAASGRGGPPPKNAIPLCFTWEASERLRRGGIASKAWEDLIPAADAATLMERTFRLADEWHRDGDGDITDLDGYSLGRLFRWLTWIFTFHPAFKFTTALARAAETHRPETVFCEDAVPPIHRAVLKEAAAALGFKVVAVASGQPPLDVNVWSLPRLEAPLSKRIAAKVLNAAAAVGARGRTEWLLSYYHSLESVADAAHARGISISFADIPPMRRMPSLLGKASAWLEPAASSGPDAADDAALTVIASRWDRLRASSTHAARYEWMGTDLRPVVEPDLDRLVREQFPPWVRACRRVETRWARRPPARLLLPFPGPPYQQVLQMAARRHKTPFAVLLHGLPFSYSFPYEHPLEGHFLVWGPGQEALYAEPAARGRFATASVGNPYLDRYAGRRRARTGPIRRVLLLSHPEIRSTPLSSGLDPARHARAAAEVFARFPELDSAVRLHPSESEDYYRGIVGAVAPRMEIIKGGASDACLERFDLVVGSFSTLLLEAILLGLPVAALNLSRDEFPPPFDGLWGAPLLRSAADLDRLLRSARQDPDGVRSALCARHDEIIARFAGRVDGNAAVRVSQFLEKPL